MKRILRPATNRQVCFPLTTRALAADGEPVDTSKHATYWHRRVLVGDVEDITDNTPDEPTEQPAKAPTASKKSKRKGR